MTFLSECPRFVRPKCTWRAGIAGEAIFQQLRGGVGSGAAELLLTDPVGAPSQTEGELFSLTTPYIDQPFHSEPVHERYDDENSPAKFSGQRSLRPQN
jgi:hypothetical protein